MSSIVAKLTRKPVAKKVARKVAEDKAKKTPTQKGIKFGKKKDIVMPKDTDIKISTVSGTKGVTGKGEVINVGDDAVGFSNFLALQKSKGIFKREKAMRALEKIIDKGTATQKKQARDMLNKMKETKKKSDAEATRKQTAGRRGKSTKTIAKSDDPFFRALEEAKDGVLGKDYEKLLPKQKEQIEQAARAFGKSEFEKEVRAKLAEPKTAPKSVGSAVENKRKIGMNKGGLKMPSADQVGLKKLPTQVRNKMGYMYGGGMTKKPKMGNTDYRKGGMVMIVLDMMKKKKGRK